MPSGQVQLDPEFLISAARAIATETAQRYEIYVSPNAMQAIDRLVSERIDALSTANFDFAEWQGHVRHISDEVAQNYQRESIRRIDSADLLYEKVKTVFSVYPYD